LVLRGIVNDVRTCLMMQNKSPVGTGSLLYETIGALPSLVFVLNVPEKALEESRHHIEMTT